MKKLRPSNASSREARAHTEVSLVPKRSLLPSGDTTFGRGVSSFSLSFLPSLVILRLYICNFSLGFRFWVSTPQCRQEHDARPSYQAGSFPAREAPWGRGWGRGPARRDLMLPCGNSRVTKTAAESLLPNVS